MFIPITFFINKNVNSMIISCAVDVISCGLLYLIILLLTKDKVFFDICDRCSRKVKRVLGH